MELQSVIVSFTLLSCRAPLPKIIAQTSSVLFSRFDSINKLRIHFVMKPVLMGNMLFVLQILCTRLHICLSVFSAFIL